MLRRFVWLLVAFPVAVLLLTLAVANRHGVRLVLDPFRPMSRCSSWSCLSTPICSACSSSASSSAAWPCG